jgi:hypothetical protein
VLIFTWISSSTINADWSTRLLPYMALGGGILFEDPGNLPDLSPGITAFNWDICCGGIAISAVVPGLTDGIANSFVNNHIGFSAWDPALSPFITLSSTVVGLYGQFDGGCIVATGPDQHYHGHRDWPDPNRNQYDLLVNEVRWVTGLSSNCGLSIVGIDIKPGSDPNSINCNNAMAIIPVAILTTPDFDATTVDHTTVTFEGASEFHSTPAGPKRHEQDADGDGDIDLVFHFRLGDTGLTCASTDGTLSGELFDGSAIEGTDAVNMIDRGAP